MSDDVASRFQQIGINGVHLWEEPVQVAPFLKTMDGPAGEKRRPRRCAGWGGDEGVREASALSRNAIEMGCADGRISIDSRVRERPVVCNRQDNVRAFEGCGLFATTPYGVEQPCELAYLLRFFRGEIGAFSRVGGQVVELRLHIVAELGLRVRVDFRSLARGDVLQRSLPNRERSGLFD